MLIKSRAWPPGCALVPQDLRGTAIRDECESETARSAGRIIWNDC